MNQEASFQPDNRRIAKNTIILYIRMLALLGISLYTTRVILHALGEYDYGLYNVVGGIVALFSVVNSVLSAGTSRFLTYGLGKGDFLELKNTFSAAFILHFSVAIFVLLLSETVGIWFLNTQLVIPAERMSTANWVFQFSIVTAMLSLTQVPYSASIISHERMDIYAWAGLGEGCFKLASALALLYLDISDKLLVYGILNMSWNILLQLFYRFFCLKKFPETSLMRVKDKVIYKKLLKFSLWDFGGAMGSMLNTQGVNFILNIFFGLKVNAARGVAVQVDGSVQQFSVNYMTAVRPQIVKCYATKDYTSFFRLIFDSSKYAYFLLLVVALPLFLEAEYVLQLWLGEVPQYTVEFLRCILIVDVFRSMARPVIDGCHATGNIKYLNIYTSCIVVLALPLSWFAFKHGFPPLTVFVINGVLYSINNFIELYALKKEADFSICEYLTSVMLKCLAVTIVVSIIPIMVVFLYESSFIRLCACVATSILSVGLGLLYLVIERKQRQQLFLLLKSRIGRK